MGGMGELFFLPAYPASPGLPAPACSCRTCSIAALSECLRSLMSDQRSPTSATREGIDRRVNVRGPTSPRSSSSHVQGADTGAPGLARTA